MHARRNPPVIKRAQQEEGTCMYVLLLRMNARMLQYSVQYVRNEPAKVNDLAAPVRLPGWEETLPSCRVECLFRYPEGSERSRRSRPLCPICEGACHPLRHAAF